MRKTLKSVGAAALAAATVVSGLSFGSAAAVAAPESKAKSATQALAPMPLIFKDGGKFFSVKEREGVITNQYWYATHSSESAAIAAAARFTPRETSDGWFQFGDRDERCVGLHTSYGPPLVMPYYNCGLNGSKFRLKNGKLQTYSGSFVGGTTPFSSGNTTYYGLTADAKGWTMVGDLSPISPAPNGGFASAGVGFPATIPATERRTVHFGAAANSTVTSMTNTTITVDAPSGSKFAADQTSLTGEYKPSGGSWASSTSLTMTGTVNAAGTQFTGRMATPGSSFALHDGHQIRWGIDVVAGSTAGTQNMAFSGAGTTNFGAFSFSGNTAVTVTAAPAEFTAEVNSVDNAKREATLAGLGTPGSQVKVNGTTIATVGQVGAWTGVVSGLNVGANTITVEQWDGNTKTDQANVVVTIVDVLADGHGPDTVLNRGTGTDVFGHVNVTEDFHSVNGGKVTFTAPEGTIFTADQDEIIGSYKSATGSWVETQRLKLSGGTLSSDGTKYTYDWSSDSGITFPKNGEIRWGISVNTPTTGDAISDTLRYTVTGDSNKGTFAAGGSTKTAAPAPAENGGFLADGIGHPTTIAQGSEEDVAFGMQADTATTLEGTTRVVLTAPAGTTFASDMTKFTGAYKTANGSWVTTPGLDVTGTVSDDGRTFTGSIAAGTAFAADSEARWTGKLDAAKDAAVGTRNLGFTVDGATNLGSFSVVGNSAITVAKSADPAVPVAVTAPKQGAVVDSARPVFEGTGDNGATIEIRGSSRVVATTTVTDGKWSVPANVDLADGKYNLRVTQTAANGDVSTATASFSISTTVNVVPVKVVSPDAGSITENNYPTFTGTGHEGATVIVRGSVTELGRAVVKDGKWELTSGIRLANGDYNFYVDQIPTKGDSSTIRHAITVNNPITAPITVTTPEQGGSSLTVVDTLRPVFQGTATPFAEITVGSARTTIATATADAKGNWTATTDRDLEAGGTYNLTATQAKGGKTNTTAAAFVVSSKASAIKPLVLTAPEQNSTVDTLRPVFEGTATPFAKITVGSSRVTIAEGEADKDGKWTATTNRDLERGGTYSGLTVRQTTTDDRTSTTTSSFTVARDAGAEQLDPITVSKPTDGEVVQTVRPTFVGKATPGATITVGSSKTTVATGTANQDGDFSLEALIDLARGGTYTGLTVKQEKNGATSSTTVTFSVARDAEGSDSLRPITVSKPTDGEVVTTVRPTFVGKATPGATITVGSSKTTVATGTANQDGDFSLEALIDLARGGTYTGLTVKQEKDGQKSEIKINFSIDRNAS
ncbi:hypothetical protein SAMN05660766_3482 [Curtobacterium sp. 314Chir4.1]|uniref:beta strand repeat-containing protein n=1 Tax=Curtobacterium sp. 314Chir4.1 TaxID=1279028 RepID=UPI000BD56B79|nr:Ig-like domain-containing protein [Curtobacterium sp. 314Chir4.1]SOC89749.1 hypothetical protein SAMN05660766_3482 [Curtobacterium sp. 314Chir4.1]